MTIMAVGATEPVKNRLKLHVMRWTSIELQYLKVTNSEP